MGVAINSSETNVHLNNSGLIAGSGWDAERGFAFVWDQQAGVQDLGTLGGGSYSSADVLNESGQVAGTADTGRIRSDGYPVSHPFRWDADAGLLDLGLPPGATSAEVLAISGGGLVVGSVADWPGSGGLGGFGRDTATGLTSTFGSQDSVATDVNDQGQVVGVDLYPSEGNYHAYLWDAPGSTPQDLGTIGDWPMLNEQGQVAGNASAEIETEASGYASFSCAFLWEPRTGRRIYIGVTRAYALNDQGQVAGSWWYDADRTRAFVWDADTGMTDLGVLLGGDWSEARDINERGQVVGSSGLQGGWTHAFFWDPRAGLTDLGVLDEGQSSYGWDVNDAGQAVGWSGSTDPDREGADWGSAVLWTPR